MSSQTNVSSMGSPLVTTGRWGWYSKSYFVDYGTIVAVLILLAVFYFGMKPAQRTFLLTDPSISLPMKPDTVSDLAVIGDFTEFPKQLLAGGVPIAFFAISQVWIRLLHDFHNSALGLVETLSFLLMNLEFMKSAYGELRPDFLARCEYDVTTHECTGAPDVVNEGRKAFPSGHAAVAFAAFVYVVLWIIGKTKPFRYGRVHVLLLANFFIGIALYIGATRVVDNKHHYHDIAWGAFFGIIHALTFYLVQYPNPLGKNSHLPRTRAFQTALEAFVLKERDPPVAAGDDVDQVV